MAKRKKTTGGRGTKAAAGMRKSKGGPTRRSCACLQVHFGLLDRFPDFRFNQAEIEDYTRTCLRAGRSAPRKGVVKIPVVVHVVYKTAREKISNAQVLSQIKVLNQDFRKKNTDRSKVPSPFKPLAADPKIEFVLAKRDPKGKPTKGILWKKTNKSSFSTNDDVKSASTGGVEPWDTTKYLNIWVCTLGGNLLGYAQFPGGPPDADGVVILNTAFGTTGTASAPFNKGRTATHELGHFLNLSHIWGESRWPTCSDSDYVDDTPNQFAPNSGKPTFPSISCANDPDGDMFVNYMDYVDDAAMFMFTEGQVARMRATLSGPRSDLGNCSC